MQRSARTARATRGPGRRRRGHLRLRETLPDAVASAFVWSIGLEVVPALSGRVDR